MEDILDNNNNEKLKLTDKDLFTQIWTSPRQVFRYINDNRYDKYVTILLILAGISRSFDRAMIKNIGDKMSLWAIIGTCIILGGLLGWIIYYVYAALVSWTGKWLDGKGNTSSILRILAYAMLPTAIGLIFFIPQLAINGIDLFKRDGDVTSTSWIFNVIIFGSIFLQGVLTIWTLVFCIVGIAEVQKFSLGKAILNILLPIIFLISIVLTFVFILK